MYDLKIFMLEDKNKRRQNNKIVKNKRDKEISNEIKINN